jgi:hypothetical protein
VADHLISTIATEQTCRCGTRLLVALDSGISVRVDARQLPDRTAELTALVEGRYTFTRIHIGYLVLRTAGEITAPALTGTVHREHRCPSRPDQLTIDQIGAS